MATYLNFAQSNADLPLDEQSGEPAHNAFASGSA
jgi:hypothetical protein